MKSPSLFWSNRPSPPRKNNNNNNNKNNFPTLLLDLVPPKFLNFWTFFCFGFHTKILSNAQEVTSEDRFFTNQCFMVLFNNLTFIQIKY